MRAEGGEGRGKMALGGREGRGQEGHAVLYVLH